MKDGPRYAETTANFNRASVASHKIERYERLEGGVWSIAGMSIESEITLHNQERGKEGEYCVTSVNKVGEGMPSNTVMAVFVNRADVRATEGALVLQVGAAVWHQLSVRLREMTRKHICGKSAQGPAVS